MELTVEQRRALAMAAARRRAAEDEQTRRSVSGMSDQQLSAAAYEQPQPPPGVNIHMGDGRNMLQKGGGVAVEQSQAEALARAEREKLGAAGTVGDVSGSILRGIPFLGEFAPRAVAGVNAALGDGNYADNLTRAQAVTNTFDEDRPFLSTASKVAGGIGSTVALAPMAAGSVAGGLLGVGAKTLPSAIARGGVAGLTQGMASGLGQTKDLTDVPRAGLDAATNGGIGLVLGSAIPAAIGSSGRVVDALRNRGSDVFSSVPTKTVDWLTSQLEPARIANLKADMARLGPEAMPADVSPVFRGIARDAAAQPEMIETIVGALGRRDTGKNGRIAAALADLGPARSPLQIETQTDAAFKAISPEYRKLWANAKAVDTSSLAQTLDALAINKRGGGAEAAEKVRNMLNIKGTNQLDPNPETLHEVRMAIDGMMEGADSKTVGVLNTARKAIDAELAAKVPGIKDIDAKWAEVARGKTAYNEGRSALEGGQNPVWPDDFARQRRELAQPTGNLPGPSAAVQRHTEGVRAKLEEIVGGNANDVSALNRILKGDGDWNRTKLVETFGKDKAERMLSILDAEMRFQTTSGKVLSGSDTAQTKGFAEHRKEAFTPTPGAFDDVSITNFPFKIPQNIMRGMREDRAKAMAEEAARNLGRLAVAQGPQADAVVQALLARSQRSNALSNLYAKNYGAGAVPSAASPVAQALMNALVGPR